MSDYAVADLDDIDEADDAGAVRGAGSHSWNRSATVNDHVVIAFGTGR
ncbi:MAG TPA: hypothetical protein VNN79_10490 [Actinomycetota bacterium]|nr:hypothetical protein [Actinomycetota bacterium]